MGFVAPIAGSLLGSAAGASIAGSVGAGVVGTAIGSALGGAAGGALGAGITGGDVGKSAVMGGLGGMFAGTPVSNALSSAFSGGGSSIPASLVGATGVTPAEWAAAGGIGNVPSSMAGGGSGGFASMLSNLGGSFLSGGGAGGGGGNILPQQRGGVGGLGGFLSNLIPVAAGLATDNSGQLDIENVNVMTPEQAELLRLFSLRAAYELQRDPVPFEGQLSAPATGLQRGVFSQLEQNLPSIAQSPQFAQERALSTFETGVSEPARRNFFQNIVPQLQAQANQQNALSSSSLTKALAREGRSLEENLAGQRGLFVEDAIREAQRQQLDDLTKAAIIGEQQRSIEQQGIAAQLQEFLRLNQIPSPALAAVSGSPLQASQFAPIVQQQGASPFTGLLSNAGQGIGRGLGGSLGSILGNLFS